MSVKDLVAARSTDHDRALAVNLARSGAPVRIWIHEDDLVRRMLRGGAQAPETTGVLHPAG